MMLEPLPIDPFLPQVTQALREHGAVVVVAEPGAGKTTRLPPAMLRGGAVGAGQKLVVLQPRRVAARAVAARIASENRWTLGEQVGYQVRFERVMSSSTPLRIVTEGILTRMLLDDPSLAGIGGVVLDEFHERSIHSDLCLSMLREIRQAVRPDLRLVVMSATLDAQPVAAFLSAPVVRVPGRTFPVEIRYAPLAGRALEDAVVSGVEQALAGEQGGDVLVFLPGAGEIARCQQALASLTRSAGVDVLPLHGSLPVAQQQRALHSGEHRRVVLATNIAETSLTIPAVRTVIDSGLARIAGYDARRGLDHLELSRISQASAAQRAGRAGRTAPGQCLRLWSEKEHHALSEFETPEIRRIDLASTALTLLAWGQRDLRAFEWFEPPADAAIDRAIALLRGLGAIDDNNAITPTGRQMAALPLHPRVARLLLAGRERGLVHAACAVAALLGEKDIALPDRAPRRLRAVTHRGDSDLLRRLQLLAIARARGFHVSLLDDGIDPAAAAQVEQVRRSLLRLLDERDDGGEPQWDQVDPEQLGQAVLQAYPDRLCRRRGGDDRGVMVGGGGVQLASESVVRDAELFVALDVRGDDRQSRGQALVRLASAVDPQWLIDLLPQRLSRTRQAIYDAQRQRVVGRVVTRFEDLVLREDDGIAVTPDEAARVLSEALAPQAEQLIDECAASLLRRVRFAAALLPAVAWPGSVVPSPSERDLLTHACVGATSKQQVVDALTGALESMLTWAQWQVVNTHAPEHVVVPTGSRIRLDYTAATPGPPARGPVLAVRLQELFGLSETPRVANGRVAVVLHLLGPNYRPVQITDDLPSFWRNTYPQVRKDLRVRYPKHAWPDDPTSAAAVRRGPSTR